ncbi:YisL family protein [Virgibacillus sp. YIM 98842]|uniref:YisL family protein n=1 Tax=Virgibacillus sp. YIM 98842 TaxID=2663533 RepID=UPI0013DA456F|nr:YisL family protein [Virgibacillus sp. YIM 98842]
MTHMHITGWVLALILFIVALVMYNQGKAKPGKILHMILRLDYLFILYTGGDLIAHYFGGSSLLPEAIVKGLAGIWVIAAMEMILVRNNKGKPTKSFWIQLIIALLITLILGFWRLPM